MTLYASSSRKRPGEGKDAGEGDVNVRFARVSRGLMNRTDTSRENERRGSNIFDVEYLSQWNDRFDQFEKIFRL